MSKISSSLPAFARHFALNPPVAVARNGRKHTVSILIDEYHWLKCRDRQVLTLADFTEADIAALEAARAPASSKAFDHEMLDE